METKTCSACLKEKPPDSFRPQRRVCHECRKEQHRSYAQNNRDKRKITNKAWREANAERLKEYDRDRNLQKYGLTSAEYSSLLEKQNYVCAVCKRPNDQWDSRTQKHRALAVDHDHKTGRVRGLLCCKCNPAIGFAEDDPTRLLMLYEYLSGDDGADRSIAPS